MWYGSRDVELIGQYAAIKTIKTNLALTKQPEHFTVFEAAGQWAIRQFAEAGQQFDPYRDGSTYAPKSIGTTCGVYQY